MHYFGYGAMANEDVMTAVIGRTPIGVPATVVGIRLGIQRLDQMLESVQTLLRNEWPDSFQSYVVIPDPDGRVSGMVWEITEKERDLVSDWELVDTGWFKVIDVTAQTSGGSSVLATTEVLGDGQEYDMDVEGKDYPQLLNPLEDMLRVAKKAREEAIVKFES